MKKLSLILVLLVGFTSYAASNTVDDYKKACLKQDAQGCLNLGLAYAKGIETEKNYELAKDFLGIACDLGNVQACTELKDVDQHRSDSTETEEDNEIVVHRKACDRGDGDACLHLGILYEDERRNYTKAAEYYKKSCDLGDGLGCVFLGVLYEEGAGVERNYPKAVEYFKKACDLGGSAGCSILGFLYEKGECFMHNNTKAKEYYKKACDLGNKDACAKYRKMRDN